MCAAVEYYSATQGLHSLTVKNDYEGVVIIKSICSTIDAHKTLIYVNSQPRDSNGFGDKIWSLGLIEIGSGVKSSPIFKSLANYSQVTPSKIHIDTVAFARGADVFEDVSSLDIIWPTEDVPLWG